MSPVVSVIVPVYNTERYLSRCIDSILCQSFANFELILVDDGSIDQSGAICDDYALKDDRICVIHQENERLSAARNAGMEAAKGEWIALIDSDDWVHKDYLKILLSGALEDTDIVLCKCMTTAHDQEADQACTEVRYKSLSLKDIYKNHYARTRAWGRIMRRGTIGDLRFISETEPMEDACFNELLFRKDMSFRMTDEKLYYYYIRSDSAIHTNMGRTVLNATNILVDYLDQIDDAEKRKRIIKRCYKFAFSARYSEMFAGDYTSVKNSCRKTFRQLDRYLAELDTGDRLMMRAFSASPGLYRVCRILNDPSLIEYEKNQKRAQI